MKNNEKASNMEINDGRTPPEPKCNPFATYWVNTTLNGWMFEPAIRAANPHLKNWDYSSDDPSQFEFEFCDEFIADWSHELPPTWKCWRDGERE